MRTFIYAVIGVLIISTIFGTHENDTTVAHTYTATALPQEPPPLVASSTKATSAKPATPTYNVIKVVDGDTLAIEKDGKSVTLRLIGLDTPETVDPRKEVQCYGIEASNKAKSLLSQARISIEADSSQGTLDKYGRTLAYVILPDGTNFNEYMIREGYGYEYTYNDPYRYQTQFKAAEESARTEKKGLWNPAACTPSTEATSPPAPLPIAAGSYECSKNTYNCTSFKTQQEAQAVFNACGGTANDVHKMDSDNDGEVCESLP